MVSHVPNKSEWDRVFGHRIKKDDNGCYLWTGYTSKSGYGRLTYNGKKSRRAHCVSWELWFGGLPKIELSDGRGTCVCHHCDTRNCVRPEHLFAGAHIDNMQDMERKGRGRHLSGEEHYSAGGRGRPEIRGDKHWTNIDKEKRLRGETHGVSKLTDDIVREIRHLYPATTFTELANKYGVTIRTISLAYKRITWGHVK